MAETISAETIGTLREAVVNFRQSLIYKDVVEPRDAVFARFQPTFKTENIQSISADEFKSFLLFENNHHWTGLHRQGTRMCSDMDTLRKALLILMDEKQKVDNRLDQAVKMVSGMGKNIATAILTIAYPSQYGVWNNRSEANMKFYGIWPSFNHGESFGSRYIKVNNILLQLREELEIDLWNLDALWWFLDDDIGEVSIEEKMSPVPEGPGGFPKEQKFGLERHLHEFLRDNWQYIDLGKEWELYGEPGDEEAGYEYPCDVGRIDLLFKHKAGPQWLVVELKRNQTSDQTIGQVLRYMGWVRQHLAEDGEMVRGLIICRDADKPLH